MDASEKKVKDVEQRERKLFKIYSIYINFFFNVIAIAKSWRMEKLKANGASGGMWGAVWLETSMSHVFVCVLRSKEATSS